MGVAKWSRTFVEQPVVDSLFGGVTQTLGPSSSVVVQAVQADGDCIAVEHSGRNEMPDDRRYDNLVARG